MSRLTHKHEWWTAETRGVNNVTTDCRIECRECRAAVEVVLIDGKVKPKVLRDSGWTFTREDGARVVELAAAELGPPSPWLVCEECGCVYRRLDAKCGACGASEMFGEDWERLRRRHPDMPEVPEVGGFYYTWDE